MGYRVTTERDRCVLVEDDSSTALDLTLAFRAAKIRAGWESRTTTPQIKDRIDIKVLSSAFPVDSEDVC